MGTISIFAKKSTKEFNIIALYNSPHTKAPHLYAIVDCIIKERGNVLIIIVGDFNISTPVNNNTPLCNYMKSNYHCYQYVKEYVTKYKQQLIWYFQITPIKIYQQLITIGLITKWSIW